MSNSVLWSTYSVQHEWLLKLKLFWQIKWTVSPEVTKWTSHPRLNRPRVTDQYWNRSLQHLHILCCSHCAGRMRALVSLRHTYLAPIVTTKTLIYRKEFVMLAKSRVWKYSFYARAIERFILAVKMKKPNCITLKLLKYHWNFARLRSKKLYYGAKWNSNSTYQHPMTLKHCWRAFQMTQKDGPWKKIKNDEDDDSKSRENRQMDHGTERFLQGTGSKATGAGAIIIEGIENHLKPSLRPKVRWTD